MPHVLTRRFGRPAALFFLLCAGGGSQAAPPLQRLQVPPGFHVAIYSDQVPDARKMTVGDKGTVFVGSSDAGKVYALTDDHDGRADKVRVIASGLHEPSGVAYHDGALYVSAVERILKFPDIESHLDDPAPPQVVTDKLPDRAHANGRFIAFGPDGKLYVSIGAPCNVCEKPGFGKIVRMNPDGSDMQDVALGVRNSAGFDWQPGTHKFWFTDNGRDELGDDIPSDELNRVDRLGENFGFPYCHEGDIPDPEFGKGHPCKDYAPPAFKPGAHVATLGMRFYTGKMFPESCQGDIFIAEHGSWNRSSKSGYRVVAVHVEGDKATGQQPFLTGFLDGQTTLGRPVDVQPLPDGSLLVSDDFNGAIYRVTHGK
ncbi:MAG TPA: PQQ-dependent sugar dehydrogenase [Rhodanobacteraceae bacterium]|nr:PQQ-dependent sugar dehydrogenase [Rhodanobacteraceae bacterium]